jgi:hypothetical protein
MNCIFLLAGLAVLPFVGADKLAAAPPALDIPVACDLGGDCFIQFYVDRDVQEGIADYRSLV